ncbi:MAG: sarcosine oxidase subunit delta [Chloroflexota bacterium]
MVILNCPNCGERNVSEFRYGGEYNPRPANPLDTSDAEWADYIFLKENRFGVQKEWWFHASGCGTWFLAERHTKTNLVVRTYFWEASPAGESGGEPTKDAVGEGS